MEPGSIAGVGGYGEHHGPLTRRRPRADERHARGSLGVDITALLRPGSNTLRIEITDARPEGGLLNPLYVAGDFGVGANPLCLIERPEMAGSRPTRLTGCRSMPVRSSLRSIRLSTVLQSERVCVDLIADAPFHERRGLDQPRRRGTHCPGSRAVELASAALKPGTNEVRVKVYTTLIRAFEGQWFDYDTHCYREVGVMMM